VVFHASNETEQKDIERELGPKMRVVIAGNLPPKELPVANTPRSKIAGNLSLISVARIAPEKNLLYALQALSSVREGHIEFSIYGPVYDAGYWKKCQDLIATLPPNVIVNYCGSVESEQVPALLARCHFLFMPTLGENFGHVILQALSAGCPPIISDRTPWRGLEMRKAGWDLSLEKENQFESLLTRLCSIGQAEFNMLSQNAFAYAQHYIHNPTTAEANRKLFR
jgi:glycosyltransferase involved in cell wall biosynthesis